MSLHTGVGLFVGPDTGNKTASSSGMGHISFYGIFGWPKKIVQGFLCHPTEKPNELFGQPNIVSYFSKG